MGRLIIAAIFFAGAVANFAEISPSLGWLVGIGGGIAAAGVLVWVYRHPDTSLYQRRMMLFTGGALIAVPVLFYFNQPWLAIGVLLGAFPTLGWFLFAAGIWSVVGRNGFRRY